MYRKRISLALFLILTVLFLTTPVKAEAAKTVYATIGQVQQIISDALEPLNTSLNALANRVTNLETTISPMPSQITALQNNQFQTDTKLTAIEATLTPLPGQVYKLQQQNSSLMSTVDNLTGKIGSLEAQIAQLQKGVSPKEITLFPFGNIQSGQISQSVDVEGYKILTLTGTWETGTGGFGIYYSNDQTNWTHQAGMSQNSNFPPRQITIPVKGKYYRADFTGGSPFTGSLSGLLY